MNTYTRAIVVVIWFAFLAGAAHGLSFGAQLKVQEVTLYVGAPAEVKGTLVFDGGTAPFDLPKGLAPDSVEATQGGSSLSVSVKPIYGPQRGALPPEIQRYQGSVSGAKPRVPIALAFRSSGLRWSPTCTLKLTGERGSLAAQASISNDALDLAGAGLRLMSGRVGGEVGTAFSDADWEQQEWWFWREMQEMGESASAAIGGLHLVTELKGIDVPKGGSRQVPLMAAEVTVRNEYRWDTGRREGGEPARSERTYAEYTFQNTSKLPLPEALITVSEAGAVIGKGYVAWTPPGGTARARVSSVQGLAVRRTEESKPNPQTWDSEVTVKLQVENSRAEQVGVRVTEHLRSGWDYGYDDENENRTYEFSQQPEEWKKELFRWSLPVPSGGRAEISYSYREGVDLTSLRFLQITPDGSPQERQYIEEEDRAAVQFVRDPSQQRIRRVQPDGHITYRLPVPANVKRADLIVSGANTLRISLAPQVNGKPGAFKVVADLVAVAGRPVYDALNYSSFTFDLTPFLGENRVAYVLLDNPSGGEAFFAWVEAYRVPEGFLSRGQEYAVGEAGASVVAAAPRRVLFSFTPGTPAEDACIFLNRGTSLVSEAQARVAYLTEKMVYAFTIPSDVSAADCIVDAWNGFVVAVARDAGGQPSEFHEEINGLTLFGRQNYEQRWSRPRYALDLTPYLKDNPSRTIYVAIYTADQTTGWGGSAWSKIEVAALDDAEQARLARIRRQVDDLVKEERARCLLNIRTNDRGADRPYLYEDRGSEMVPLGRVVNGEAEVTYRFPMEAEYRGALLQVWLLGDSLVSYAADDQGKPGKFTDVFRARDKFEQDAIETYTNIGHAEIEITKPMLDSGAVYVRIRDGAPDKPGAVQIHTLSIMRP